MKITLLEWAKARYNPPPPMHTLRRWARDGELGPTVEKVGKEYRVAANAERLATTPAGATLIDRIQAGAR